MKENMQTNRAVSSLMKDKMKEKGITQNSIANMIEKSQPYVSARMSSLESWSINELDTIAPHLGFPNSLALIASAAGYSNIK
jgi:predicted XRE-type DNA-binding protein